MKHGPILELSDVKKIVAAAEQAAALSAAVAPEKARAGVAAIGASCTV